MKIVCSLLFIALMSVSILAQSPPTLRIVTETPGLPSELFYGNIKVKPLRLRPGTNQVITIDDVDFFVQQQYLDFLGRFPDSTGFANWNATLNGCPDGGFGENLNPSCDRVHVSAGFYQSNEFQGRGYFILRFGYVGLNSSICAVRSAVNYAEFVPALAQIGGSNSPAQEEAAKVVYTNAFVQRQDFLALFPTSMTASQYVNALESNAGVTLSNKQTLIDALNAGTMTRADVLRNVVESQVVFDKFIIPGFVTMEYFGYLRRDPDTVGYQNWVQTLTADPNNFRHMIFGFIFSTE